MKTLSKLLLLALLALPSFALAQGVNMGGTSGQFQGGGLSRAAADPIYLRLDATNDPLTGALSSSNGTYSATGAAVALVLESAFTPTAGADVPVIIQSTGDFGAADSILSVRDNTSTVQLSVRGNGDTYLGGTSLPATLYFDGGNGGLTYTNVVGARNIFFLNTSYSNAGTNMVVYSGANAAGEYGVVAGSNATTTAQTSFAVCNNCLNTSPTMVFEVLGTGAVQMDGDLTVDGGNILNALTAAGINLAVASGANAAGEYGVVVGTNDTATAQTNFAVANDIDGTPVYVLEVLGTGRVGIGGAAGALGVITIVGTYTGAAASDAAIVVGGIAGLTLEPTSEAYAINIGQTVNLDPGDASNTYGISVDPTTVADSGETIPSAFGINVEDMLKSGTGTITNSIGIRVVESAVGGTLNLALDSVGTLRTSGLLMGDASSTEFTGSAAASATINFGAVTAVTCDDSTMTLTGAAINDPVLCSFPAALEADLAPSCFVSNTNTITFRLCNPTASNIDPASGTFAARYFNN